MTKAAGILIRTKSEGQVLFLKRGPGGDYPGYWCFPGGRTEDGESAEETAKRECKEEIGRVDQAKLNFLCRSVTPAPIAEPVAPSPESSAAVGEAGAAPLASVSPPSEVDFTTFLQYVNDKFEVEKDGEHVGYAWAPADQPPQPLHPGCQTALSVMAGDELDVAKMLAAGIITGPYRFKNIMLWPLRVTGTELAFRKEKTDDKGKVIRKAEWAWRDPEHYLNPRFCERCAGLPVIYYHPEKKATLDSDEFKERVIGAIMFAYIQGNEVWCIARIYDDDAITIMLSEEMSTSPGVLIKPSESTKITLDDGTVILVEGKPSLLDHLAICKQGVWDKGGDPAGVAIHDSNQEVTEMPDEKKVEEEKKDEQQKHDADKANGDKLDAIMAAVKKMDSDAKERYDAICGRMDAVEGRMDAVEKPKEEDKKDSAKKDGEDDKDKDKGGAKEMVADKKDGEDKEDKKEEEKHDSVDVAALQREVTELKSKMPVHQSDEDYSALIAEQARADDVYGAFGKNAPRPLLGETPTGYRKRVASELKSNSAAWGKVDISKFDGAALDVAVDQIYADSVSAANKPIAMPEGQEIATTRRDRTGHMVTTFRRGGHFVRDLTQSSRCVQAFDTNRRSA